MIAFTLLALAAPAPCQEDLPGSLGPAGEPEPAQALEELEEDGSLWFDPADGWFDVSRFLEQPHGFLPLVVPITEPALGYGAVGAAVFLDPREEAGAEGWSRPNMTAIGGLWTEDGSTGPWLPQLEVIPAVGPSWRPSRRDAGRARPRGWPDARPYGQRPLDEQQ